MWGGNDMTQSQWENTAVDDGAEMRKRIVALTWRKKWLCNRPISPQRRKRRQRLPSDPLRFRVTPLKSFSLAWKENKRSCSHSVVNLVELNSWGTEEFSRLAWGQNERKWKRVEAFCGNTDRWGQLASNQRHRRWAPVRWGRYRVDLHRHTYCRGFCGAEAADARLLAASLAFPDASFTESLSSRWGVSPECTERERQEVLSAPTPPTRPGVGKLRPGEPYADR